MPTLTHYSKKQFGDPDGNLEKEIKRAHEQACLKKQDTYKDPATGCDVFTAFYLQERGSCCRSGCRHCPYGVDGKG